MGRIAKVGIGVPHSRATAAPPSRRSRSVLPIVILALAIYGLLFQPTARADEEEIAELTARLGKEPNRVDLLKQRAVLFRLEEMPADSLADLNRARELAPADREIRLQRGITLSTLRRDQEAEAELTAFLELESGVARALALAERGQIHARARRPNLAVADLSAAIAIRPALDLYLTRGQIQESIGLPAAAAAGYREALARLGRAPALVDALIRAQLAQGQFASALAEVDQELARAPVKTTWWLRRAEILAASGQKAQAQAELAKALADANRALQKRVSGIHLMSRARVLMAMGKFDEAKSDLEGCLSLVPTFSGCRELLNQL